MNIFGLHDELKRLKYEEGIDHVKSKHIAKDFDDETAKSIGKKMAQAEERGWVEPWSDSKWTTWRILL